MIRRGRDLQTEACMITCVAEVKGKKRSLTPGERADAQLQEILATTDPAVESSLEILRVSEEHYFAAVHQEGNPVPTTFSASTEA
jgi:hypothetical protein